MKDPKTALADTIKFFKENPDKRAIAMLSDMGSPFHPKATCWCAVGRYSLERGIKSTDSRDPYQFYYDQIVKDLQRRCDQVQHLPITKTIWYCNDSDRSQYGSNILKKLTDILEDMK